MCKVAYFNIYRLVILSLCSVLLGVPALKAGSAADAFFPIPLDALLNADIFTYFNNRTDGQMDTGRASFPAEMMPDSDSTIRTYGIEFLFPSKQDGDMNAIQCDGQMVAVAPAEASYLYLLATAADGNQRASLTLQHEDGTTYKLPFDVNDWCAENPGLGAVHGVASDYRHTLGNKQTCKTSIWLIPLHLQSSSPLQSIRLPENKNIYVVALTQGPAGEEQRLQTYVKDAFFPSKEKGIDRLVLLEVVEPESNRVLTVKVDDGWTGIYRPMVTHKLKSGTQSIPVWLPLVKRRTYAFDINGATLTYLDETNLFFNAPKALLEIEASHPAHPADADLGMAPAWQRPVLPETTLTVHLYIPDAPADEMELVAVLTPLDNPGVSMLTRTNLATKTTCPATLAVSLSTPEWQAGDYTLSVCLKVSDMPYADRTFTVTVVPTSSANRAFGARETELSYYGPVWTNWDQSITFDEAWNGFTNKDIVIDFPGKPYRYVFWKGASYAPIWLFDQNFITLEWLEGWPRQEGAVDCVEPLQDKECKYSRIELLSSTPARARIQWNYAETDFNLKIIHDEHAEEIYTVYPDGICIRKVTGFFEKGRWHECCEFIVGAVAGTTPATHYPPQALSLLNCRGDQFDLYWPTPQEAEFSVWDEYIGLARCRNEPDVFLACEGKETGLHVFSNNPDWLSEMFFCMPHWPIQRGLPTTNERTIDECYTRPTHASLLNFYARPYERYKDRTVWALLLGIAPDDEEELRDMVHGWLYPPMMTMRDEAGSETAVKYDIYQRGYVIDMKQQTECQLILKASTGSPQIRPALILSNVPETLSCTLMQDGQPLIIDQDYTCGFEPDHDTFAVWLNKSYIGTTSLDIQLQGASEKEGLRPNDTINRTSGG